MKIFAVMLLMLFGISFLKAQTMVVETVDAVESFEVFDIKGLSAFEKDFEFLKIEFKKIPIVISNRNGNIENSIYSSWQATSRGHFYSKGDSIESSFAGHVKFAFIFEAGKFGSGSNDREKVKIVFDTANIIRKIYFTTSGSHATSGSNSVSVFGVFEIDINNLSFTFDSNSSINATMKNREIDSKISYFSHRESITSYPGNTTQSVELLKVREEDLTDDSQIIITIE